MAGLSDALLGLAGGAAEAFNTDVEKRRESDRRMVEQANQLLTGSRVRVAETKFTNDLAVEQKNAATRQKIASFGGPDSPSGRYMYGKEVLGLSEKELEAAYKNNAITVPEDFMKPKNIEMPGKSVFDNLASSVSTKRAKARVAEMKETFGNFNPSASSEENLGLPEAGHPTYVAEDQDSFFKDMFSKSPVVKTEVDAKTGNAISIATDPNTGEILSVSRQGDFDKKDERVREKDVNGILRYVDDGSEVFPDVTKERTERKMEKDVNGVLRFVDDSTAVFPGVEAEIKKSDFLTKFDTLTDIVKQLQNPGLDPDERAVLEEQRALIRGNVSETADKDRQDLLNKERKYQEQFGSLDLGVSAARRLATIVTAEQGGPRAIATKIADNIDSYAEGIFGSDVNAQDIINRYATVEGDQEYTSERSKEMSNAFKQGSVDFLAEAIKWDIADALKRGDKLTTDDLKRVDSMLTAPFGSTRYASQLNEAINLMEAHKDKQVTGLMVGRGIARRDIKKIADPENPDKTLWLWYDSQTKMYNEFLP